MDARCPDPHSRDLAALTKDVLLLCREMLRQDDVQACLRLGLDRATGDVLRDLTIREIEILAESGLPILQPRLPSPESIGRLAASTQEQEALDRLAALLGVLAVAPRRS